MPLVCVQGVVRSYCLCVMTIKCGQLEGKLKEKVLVLDRGTSQLRTVESGHNNLKQVGNSPDYLRHRLLDCTALFPTHNKHLLLRSLSISRTIIDQHIASSSVEASTEYIRQPAHHSANLLLHDATNDTMSSTLLATSRSIAAGTLISSKHPALFTTTSPPRNAPPPSPPPLHVYTTSHTVRW